MVFRKIRSGAATALAIAALASWASVAKADLPSDVAGALVGTQAEQLANVQTLATSNAGNTANFTQLVELVAAGVSQEQAAAFAGALAAACGVSANNAQTTQALVGTMVGAFPEAGGAIVGSAISGGCSAEVAANTLQLALLTAAGQSLALSVVVVPESNPGVGVNLGQEPFVKELATPRLGNRDPLVIQPFQEEALSPTTMQDGYVPPVVVVEPTGGEGTPQ